MSTCEDPPESPASGTPLANEGLSRVPYIPTVDNFDCLGIMPGQLDMNICDELPPPYNPAQASSDRFGVSRSCNGANTEISYHFVPTLDNFDLAGFPASAARANLRAPESMPEIMQSHGPTRLKDPDYFQHWALHKAEQPFCRKAARSPANPPTRHT
eukprot:CAMPEP_0172901212 /NCGR_PEP_ID=MMETSP1075-20121228/165785_1 /TAXON_ID=2916 /ORGANISM="Ceratium fusus, Strain PA161109" /LENGTH=156 /DNA_ID=CAMNT_0013757551 /DNA_START=45 /DNA_END=512 /DNA_ORIENTATION=-